MLNSRAVPRQKTHIVSKPWGRFKQFTLNEPSTVKILEVEPGETLSLQSHKYRDEIWIFLDDGAEVQINEQFLFPRAGEEVTIPRGTKHRLASRWGSVRVLEVAFGHFDENDIVRYADRYGRVAETAISRVADVPSTPVGLTARTPA